METLFPAMKTNQITRTHGEKTRIFTIDVMCDQDELILESGAEESLKQIFVSWESSNNLIFGNARDVRKLLDEIKICQRNRLVKDQGDSQIIKMNNVKNI